VETSQTEINPPRGSFREYEHWFWSDAKVMAFSLISKTDEDPTQAAGESLYEEMWSLYKAFLAAGIATAIAYAKRRGLHKTLPEEFAAIVSLSFKEFPEQLVDPMKQALGIANAAGRATVPVAEITTSFNMVDARAVDALSRGIPLWVSEKIKRMRPEIADLVRREVLEKGVHPRDLVPALKDALNLKQKRDDLYFRFLAHNAAASARNLGVIRSMVMVGIETYIIYTQLDERVCPICAPMHGQVFRVEHAKTLLRAIDMASNPEVLADVWPWHTRTSPNRESPEDIVSFGGHVPPFHFGCRCYIYAQQ